MGGNYLPITGGGQQGGGERNTMSGIFRQPQKRKRRNRKEICKFTQAN